MRRLFANVLLATYYAVALPSDLFLSSLLDLFREKRDNAFSPSRRYRRRLHVTYTTAHHGSRDKRVHTYDGSASNTCASSTARFYARV